ncbi:MAG: DUF4199 domain-containing protein [Crocinitomicaceae bacterium]|nr:DUF4199 domain-containing protein [Crocinitomicaceae bacterium]
MKITVKVGLIFAGLWILTKMIFFWSGALKYNVVPSVLLNMLFVLLAIAIGLYLHKLKQTDYTNALGDIKSGMTAGVPYAFIVSIFIYFYYEKIDPGFNEHQIAEREYALIKKLDEPDGLRKIQSANPELEVFSREEIIAKANDSNKGFYNAGSTMTLSMLALLLLATLYSIFVTVIMRRIIFRDSKRFPYPSEPAAQKNQE